MQVGRIEEEQVLGCNRAQGRIDDGRDGALVFFCLSVGTPSPVVLGPLLVVTLVILCMELGLY